MIQTAQPTWQPANVRIGTVADAESLFFLLVNDLREDNDMGYPVSEKKVADTIMTLLKGERGIAGVIEKDGEIVGSIGIAATQLWYSDRWLLAEVWVFVHPDHRNGTGYGDALFQFAKWHQEDMEGRTGQAMDLERSVRSFKRLDAKMRFWRRYGPQIGGIFLTGEAR